MPVSIAEILNAGAAPDSGNIALGSSEGIGNTAVLEYNPQVGSMLMDWSNNQNKRDLYLYNQQQQRLQDFMTKFDKVNLKELMPSDYNTIHDDFVRLQGDVANNIDVISNPSSNKDRYADLMTRMGDLQRRIAGSQADYGFYKLNKEAMDKEPKTFANSDNIGYLDEFAKKPLGQREYRAIAPTINMPWENVAKRAAEIAQQKLATAQKDGKYLQESEAVRYADDEYLNAFNTLSRETIYGVPYVKSAIKEFEALPEPQRRTFGPDDTSAMQSWLNERALTLKPQDQLMKANIVADPFALQQQRAADEMAQIAARGAEARKTAQFRFNLENADIDTAANDINNHTANVFNQLADLVSTGTMTQGSRLKLAGVKDQVPVSNVTRYLSEDDRRAMARKRFDDVTEKEITEYPEIVYYGNVNGVQTLIPVYKTQPIEGQRGVQFRDQDMARFTPSKLQEGFVNNIYKSSDPQKFAKLNEVAAQQRERILGTRQWDEYDFDSSGKPTTRVFAERTNTDIGGTNATAAPQQNAPVPSAAPAAIPTRPKKLSTSFRLYQLEDGTRYWTDGTKVYDTNGKELR